MPLYLDLIIDAINDAETTLVSRYKIKQYVERNIEGRQFLPHCLSKALKKGVENGTFIQVKQSFKFSKKTTETADRIKLYLNHIMSVIEELDENYSSRAAIKKYFILNNRVRTFDLNHFNKAIKLGFEQNMIIKPNKHSQSFQIVDQPRGIFPIKKAINNFKSLQIKHSPQRFAPDSDYNNRLELKQRYMSDDSLESSIEFESSSEFEPDDLKDLDYIPHKYYKKKHPIPDCLKKDLNSPKQTNTEESFNKLKISLQSNFKPIPGQLTSDCKVNLKTFILVAQQLAKICKRNIIANELSATFNHKINNFHEVADELLRHNIIKKNVDKTMLIFPPFETYIRKIVLFMPYNCVEQSLVRFWDIIDNNSGLTTLSIIKYEMQSMPNNKQSGLNIEIDLHKNIRKNNGIILYGNMYSRDIFILMQNKLQLPLSPKINVVNNHSCIIDNQIYSDVDFRPLAKYKTIRTWAKFQQGVINRLNNITHTDHYRDKGIIIDLFAFLLMKKLFLNENEIEFINHRINKYKQLQYFSVNEFNHYSQITEIIPERNEFIFMTKLSNMIGIINTLSKNARSIEIINLFTYTKINEQYLSIATKSALMKKLELFGQKIFTKEKYQSYKQLFTVTY